MNTDDDWKRKKSCSKLINLFWVAISPGFPFFRFSFGLFAQKWMFVNFSETNRDKKKKEKKNPIWPKKLRAVSLDWNLKVCFAGFLFIEKTCPNKKKKIDFIGQQKQTGQAILSFKSSLDQYHKILGGLTRYFTSCIVVPYCCSMNTIRHLDISFITFCSILIMYTPYLSLLVYCMISLIMLDPLQNYKSLYWELLARICLVGPPIYQNRDNVYLKLYPIRPVMGVSLEFPIHRIAKMDVCRLLESRLLECRLLEWHSRYISRKCTCSTLIECGSRIIARISCSVWRFNCVFNFTHLHYLQSTRISLCLKVYLCV